MPILPLPFADCQMHQEMAVETSPNRWATFIRQMIPHHQNAVAMAKLILKQSTFEEDGEGDSEGYEELQNMGAPQPYCSPRHISGILPVSRGVRNTEEEPGASPQSAYLHSTAPPSAVARGCCAHVLTYGHRTRGRATSPCRSENPDRLSTPRRRL
jgi:hypothetical protein